MINKNNIFIVFLLSLGTLLGAFFAFIIQVILARKLGVNEFGIFSSTFAMIVLVSPLAGLDISQLWLKVYGEEGWSANRWMPSSIVFIILSTTITLLIIVFWAFFGNHDYQTRELIFILSFYILGQVSLSLISSKLQLEESYIKLSMLQLLPHFIRTILVVLLAFVFSQWMTIENIAMIYALVSIGLVYMAYIHVKEMYNNTFLLHGHNDKKTINMPKPNISYVLQKTWPFGLASFFYFIYFQSDIVLIKYMIDDTAAAIYNVAFTVLAAIYLFPAVIYQKFLLPKIHRWASNDRKKFYEVYTKGNVLMFILGTFIMFIVWGVSSWSIPLIFGEDYKSSAILLNLLALTIPMIFVAHSIGSTLVTKEHMKNKVIFMGMVAIINLVLNIILIPTYNIFGAAISTVISNIILVLVYYIYAKKIVFKEKVHKGLK